MYLYHFKIVSKCLNLLIELVTSELWTLPPTGTLTGSEGRRKDGEEHWEMAGEQKDTLWSSSRLQVLVSAQDCVEKGVAVNHHQSGCGWFDCLRGEHPKLEKTINLKTNIALLFI